MNNFIRGNKTETEKYIIKCVDMVVENIDLSKNVPKKVLLDALKEEAGMISIFDIMAVSAHIKKDSIYVPANYSKELGHIYIKFLMRLNEIRNNKTQYEGFINRVKLQEAIKILKKQQMRVELDHNHHMEFFKIYRLITLYTTFVLNEPVHPVGMPFPGGFKIKQENGIYYCPVKESQKDNPGAVCGICIAEQDKEV